MKEKNQVILTCTECLSRNYVTHKNRKVAGERLELMKFCSRCNKHTLHKETKQRGEIMKWFNLSAIFKEIGKIRWPKKEDLLNDSVQVVLYTAFFAVFFFICQFLVSLFLKLIGVIA